MRFEDFENAMKEAVQRNLPPGWEGSELIIRHTDRIGGSYDSLTIMHPGWSAGPSINLTDMYEQRSGRIPPDWVISDYVRNMAAETEKLEKQANIIPDTYEEAKSSLYVKMVNYEANAEQLQRVPFWKMMDYAITAMHALEWADNGAPAAAYTVNRALMNKWGVTENQLISDAIDNAEKRMPMDLRPLSSALAEMADMPDAEDEKSDDNLLYILSNRTKVDGAAALFYPRALDRAAEKLGSFYILPSSIHEVLLMPEKRMDADMDAVSLDRLVRTVNRTQVEPGEVLGNRSLHYDAEKKLLETGVDYDERKLRQDMTPNVEAPERRMNL